MHGFYNKILLIDAGKKTSEVLSLSDEVLRQNLGGKGLATHLLLEHNPENVDPLSPENHIIFCDGQAGGSGVWGSCRHGVFTKSPQTGFYSESYAGGTVAEYMSRIGYDAVMIKGASDKLIWIEISDLEIRFHDASGLKGKDTFAAEDTVKNHVKENRTRAGNCGVITIGPAGENRVCFAVIENDYWRSAGRTGVGAVLGSKKIKALAFHGNQKRELFDPDSLKKFIREFAKTAKDDPGVLAYKNMGTPMMVDIMSGVGSFPSQYWHKGRSEHQSEINAGAMHERLDVTPHACLRCFIACGRMSEVKAGRHQGLKIEGPEYETIYAFGGLCEVGSIEEIAYLNDICDRLGMDTISAGNLAGLTIEAARQGRIDFEIDYGQVDQIASLLHDMAYRRGIGDLLARGIKAVAKHWDMEDQAIHVKGLEPAGYDPRVLKGMSLAYGTSDRGACHLRATFYKPELANMIDPDQIEGKAEMFAEWEDRLTIFDTMILCRFYRDLYQWDELSTMIRAITGQDLTQEEMRNIAGNITNNTRRFNLREGLTMDDDRLPKRFLHETLPETEKIITEED
ncbi:MAG: aldehyde ferredoxin oxidoreductase family protein, partial [Deltaproteobacteria bacterium]|nr:aldehyde ferredoxin oxidoreductase family protein [Deltaproteobacteria bacterium]